MSSYSQLNNYNNYTASSCDRMSVPRGAMSVQVVPVYSPPGYDTLTHGECADRHLSISQAYPANCDKFVARLCDCNCKGGVPVVPGSKPPVISPTAMSRAMFETYQRPF